VPTKNLDGLHDLTTPLSGMFVILELGLATVNLLTEFEISISITHCSQIISNKPTEIGIAIFHLCW